MQPLPLGIDQRHRRTARLFIGAITPSSETTTARAVSATSAVASRTVVSNVSRCASHRADSALGSRSRLLFDGCM